LIFDEIRHSARVVIHRSPSRAFILASLVMSFIAHFASNLPRLASSALLLATVSTSLAVAS